MKSWFSGAAAVLLEAVAEDIREYLRNRRDTIRCIVTMLTDDSAGSNPEAEGESLFEELKRTVADEVPCPSNLMLYVLCMIHKLVTSSHMPVLSRNQACVSYSASLLSWKQNLGMLLMVDAKWYKASAKQHGLGNAARDAHMRDQAPSKLQYTEGQPPRCIRVCLCAG